LLVSTKGWAAKNCTCERFTALLDGPPSITSEKGRLSDQLN
jgi:hypothetical protein